jgi:hypothetical protein
MRTANNDTATVTLPYALHEEIMGEMTGRAFRIDALGAFFLTMINFSGTAASPLALGYRRHEHAPQHVLPFYPADLAVTEPKEISIEARCALYSIGKELTEDALFSEVSSCCATR